MLQLLNDEQLLLLFYLDAVDITIYGQTALVGFVFGLCSIVLVLKNHLFDMLWIVLCKYSKFQIESNSYFTI